MILIQQNRHKTFCDLKHSRFHRVVFRPLLETLTPYKLEFPHNIPAIPVQLLRLIGSQVEDEVVQISTK